MPDPALPKISIVTPSLNQGEFIETCIKSIGELTDFDIVPHFWHTLRLILGLKKKTP